MHSLSNNKEHINTYFKGELDILDMSYLLLDKLTNNKSSSINIYFSKLNDTLINNTKRILNIDNINIYKSN